MTRGFEGSDLGAPAMSELVSTRVCEPMPLNMGLFEMPAMGFVDLVV